MFERAQRTLPIKITDVDTDLRDKQELPLPTP